MMILPAIDLKDQKVVRLEQGDFNKVTVYSDDPLKTAQDLVSQGAPWLHVVDLNGAQCGEMKNFSVIKRIAQAVKIPLEVGGGLRTIENIEKLIEIGVGRVILGTSAVENQELLCSVLARWPEKIAVSLDCSHGDIQTKGWTQPTRIRAVDFAKKLELTGLRFLIFTDIQRDGMLRGPNTQAIKEFLKHRKADVIVSGGVSGMEDVKTLLSVSSSRLWGVVVGKAIYEKTLDLREVLRLCSPSASFPA